MSDAIRVITTCTSRKVAEVDPTVEVLPGFEPLDPSFPAERLYVGEQHRRLMAGVDKLRAHCAVELWVISAKAGLVAGEERLGPYDQSFAGLPPDRVREQADRLGIASALRRLAAKACRLTLLLAGNDYFDAARLDEPVALGFPTVALVSPSRGGLVSPHVNLCVVPVGQALARRWSLPLTLLKGEIVRRILFDLAAGRRDPESVASDHNLLDSLSDWTPQPLSYS